MPQAWEVRRPIGAARRGAVERAVLAAGVAVVAVDVVGSSKVRRISTKRTTKGRGLRCPQFPAPFARGARGAPELEKYMFFLCENLSRTREIEGFGGPRTPPELEK